MALSAAEAAIILQDEAGDALLTDAGAVITIEDIPVSRRPAIQFLAIEIEAYRPSTITETTTETPGVPMGLLLVWTHTTSVTTTSGFGVTWGSQTWGEPPTSIDFGASTGHIYASDTGYRTRPEDTQGVVAYPPYLDQGFDIQVGMALDPARSNVAASWGIARLSNAERDLDAIAASWNSDGRPVRVLSGAKVFDPIRQYWCDPPYTDLTVSFTGMAKPWFLTDTALEIPLRDATYWLERRLQGSLYLGTGTYEGTAALKNKPKPKTRGGTASYPVRNITPALLDPVELIYQYNDGAGTVVAIYEGAAEVFTFDSDTTDLYSGATPPGGYRTDNSRGLFQLGSSPVHTITADVTGEFPDAGAWTTVSYIARYLLLEDLALPTANINIASFETIDADYPYTAGVYFGVDSTINGLDVMDAVLRGAGLMLIPFRDGTLRLVALRALETGSTPDDTWSSVEIITITPIRLPDALSPPPYRYRARYAVNNTIQTSDLNTASATAAQQQFVASEGPVAVWLSSDVAAAYRKPNDPAEIPGALLVEADAQAVADAWGALWGVRRRLYEITVPLSVGADREIGDVISLVYDMDDLLGGRIGQIVGYRHRSSEARMIFTVLV